MNLFDIRTILFSYVITNAICLSVVLALWWHNRLRAAGVNFWLADFGAQFVAVFLVALRGIVPGWASEFFGAPLILAGTLLLLIGLERYIGKTRAHVFNWLIVGAFTLLHAYFVFAQPSLQARNLVFSAGLLILCAQCAWLLARRADAAWLPSTRPVGAIFGLYGVVSIARFIADWQSPPNNDLLQIGWFDTLTILAYQMLFIALTFGLFWLVNRRLRADLVRDMAERHHAEAALRVDQANITALIENTDSSIWSVDVNYRLIIGNSTFHRDVRAALGRELAPGESVLHEHFPRAALEEWRGHYDRALRGEIFALETETRFRAAPRNIEYRFHPIHADDGQIVGATVLGRDITARKRAENELRASEERYRGLFEHMQEGFAYCQMLYEDGAPSDFIYLAVNPKFEELTRLKDVIGKRVTQLIPGIRESNPQLFEIYGRVAQMGAPEKFEIFLEALQMWFSVSVYSPQQAHFVAVFVVITEHKRAQAALAESNAKLELLFDILPVGVSILDRNRRIVKQNRALEKIMDLSKEGLARGDYRARTYLRADGTPMPPEEFASARVMRGEPSALNVETGIIKEDGTTIWVNVSAVAGPFADWNTILVTADITERKRAELERWESEDMFRTLTDLASVGIYLTDPQGNCLYVNPAWCEMAGLTSEQARGQGWVKGLHPEDREKVFTDWQRMVESNGTWGHAYRFQTPAGKVTTVYGLAKPQRDNTGRIVRYVGVNLDITERTRAEQALERERRDYQTIIDAAPVMIAYKSADDHFVHVNAAFAEFVGLPVEKIIGMTTFDLVKQPAVAEQGRAHDLQVIRTGEPVVNQLAYWSGFRSNREIWTLYSKYPFYDATGNAIGTVSFVVDVNDRVRAEQALRASEVLMRTIAENYPNSYVSIIEKDLTIGFTSGQEFKKQNLDPHQFVGLPLEPVFGEHAPFVREKYLETFGGAETQFELFINAQHQLYRTVPLRDSNGDIQQILVVVENITERKRAEEHLLQRTAQLAALHEIDLAISNTFDLRITLDILLRQVVAQLQVDAATVLLVNPHLHLLEYAAGFGFRYPTIQKSRVHLGEGCAGRAALERQIISGTIGAPDRADCQRLRVELADENFVTHHIAPLIVKGQVKGVLEIFQRTRREPANEWLDFFQVLAGQAAIGVDSALLFEGLQRSNAELALSYDATLEGWSRALDLRDQETEGHSQRVTEMAVRLARAMGMNDAELVHVRRGALLHDIGKLGVPDSILFKPDALTDAEWQVMRRHPKLAFDLIAPIVYLRPALDIPYCHHEKWDGSGYPRRLRGEHIPLAARVFAVVDVWDALRSNRAYRQAWSAEQTRAYLREQAGKYFDPRVVHAFLELVADVG